MSSGQTEGSTGSLWGLLGVEGRVSYTWRTSWHVSELRGATVRRAARSCPLSWWNEPSQLCAQEKSKDVISLRMAWLAQGSWHVTLSSGHLSCGICSSVQLSCQPYSCSSRHLHILGWDNQLPNWGQWGRPSCQPAEAARTPCLPNTYEAL